MRFGLSLPQYGFSLPAGEPPSFRTLETWTHRASDLGFDSVWISDHLFYSFARYGADESPIAAVEPLTALAGLAAVTDRIRLGTLVLCSPFRHPAIVAKMATTIDHLSGGRLDLGVGAGWLQQEFDAFGYGFGSVSERFVHMESMLIALGALFSGQPATMAGPPVTLREAPLLPAPVQRPRIPLWIGGKGGPRSLRLAARHADGWNAAWRWTPEAYGERVRAAHKACDEEDRDPATFRLSVGLYSLLAEDEAAYRALFERGRAAMPGRAIDADTPDTWRADTLSGTPDDALGRIAALEGLGVEEIVVAPWVLPFAIPEPSIVELISSRVIAASRTGP
jgi:probable F420-dependent oxidoreductase